MCPLFRITFICGVILLAKDGLHKRLIFSFALYAASINCKLRGGGNRWKELETEKGRSSVYTEARGLGRGVLGI